MPSRSVLGKYSVRSLFRNVPNVLYLFNNWHIINSTHDMLEIACVPPKDLGMTFLVINQT